MDVQTHDSVPVSENEQLSAPPGWTKKLVPASAKSVTLRKHDVVFIAPDGQEVKSKWHLSRYLKAHPDGPASSEFNWSSGEEAPKRRSTRVIATTKEDPVVEKSSTRKKGKRNASEMDSEQAETHKEKRLAGKRAKKEGKSTDLVDGGAQDKADVPDEVMHEATVFDNEATQDALPLGDVQKEENEVTEVEASKEVVTEEVVEVEASTVVTEKAVDEVSDVQGEAVVPNATTDGEVHSTQVTVVEVKEVSTEREVSVKKVDTAQERGTFIGSSGEFKGEQAAMEPEQPVEHADDNVMETRQLVEQADDNVMEPEENPEPKFEPNEEVFCKVTTVPSVVQEVSKGNDTPLDVSKQEEEPLGPLAQKEELERSRTHAEIQERSASEFNGSSVPVSVSNQ